MYTVHYYIPFTISKVFGTRRSTHLKSHNIIIGDTFCGIKNIIFQYASRFQYLVKQYPYVYFLQLNKVLFIFPFCKVLIFLDYCEYYSYILIHQLISLKIYQRIPIALALILVCSISFRSSTGNHILD